VKSAATGVAGATVVAAAIGVCSGTAAAYPQYQMSRDQTCTGCHISPAGGGLLRENGLAVAESTSQWGTAPEFFYGKVPTPSWLVLGGDLRGAMGYVKTPEELLAGFPMQIEAYGHATLPGGFSLYVDAGARESEVGKEGSTHAWSREHFLMWQQKPGDTTGLFLRAGRFMPVFGLRIAEHPTYIRKWGGTPLYGETYGLAVEYIAPKFELHATGFIKDPTIDTPEHNDGGAFLGEYRLNEKLSVGAEFMYTKSDFDKKFRGGGLVKALLPAETLLMFEAQYVYQEIAPIGAPNQIVAGLVGSKFLGTAYMLDVGLNYFNENIRITKLNREALDVNLHWFTTSHLELILTTRVEMLAFGDGGKTSGYALGQLHYRL